MIFKGTIEDFVIEMLEKDINQLDFYFKFLDFEKLVDVIRVAIVEEKEDEINIDVDKLNKIKEGLI